MARRKYRSLVVGDDRFIWNVGHGCHECHEVVRFRRFGSAGDVLVVFRFDRGKGHYASNATAEIGTVGLRDGAWLNLQEPGASRALLDEVIARGWQPDANGRAELDGWELFDAVVARREAQLLARTAERPPDQ